MINTGASVSFAVLSILSTGLVIGLGFLARPSRATSLWAFAFTLTTIAAFGWVAADALDSVPLRAAASGALLGASAFVWVGLRAWRGATQLRWWPAFAYCVASPVVLAATATSSHYALIFRLDFAAAAVVNVLIIMELIRLGADRRDDALPLALASGGYVAFSIVALIDGAVQFAQTGSAASSAAALGFVRDLNSLGSIVYVVCTLITVLLLARTTPAPTGRSTASCFADVAADRLERARAGGDQWWSVVDIRLDDPDDLRDASNSITFTAITEGFARDVRAALPADADIEARGETRFVALLPRPEGAVRQVLSQLLARVAAADADQPTSVRLSASIGWASVDAVGHDLHDLLDAAAARASEAQQRGGDRWERTQIAG